MIFYNFQRKSFHVLLCDILGKSTKRKKCGTAVVPSKNQHETSCIWNVCARSSDRQPLLEPSLRSRTHARRVAFASCRQTIVGALLLFSWEYVVRSTQIPMFQKASPQLEYPTKERSLADALSENLTSGVFRQGSMVGMISSRPCVRGDIHFV